MSLVHYSSDTETDSEAELPPRKKPALAQTRTPPSTGTGTGTGTGTLPPLPASFHSLYASSTRVSTKDDPTLHAGRKRAIPHVEGNWPTHLYLEWVPGKEEVNLLADLIQAAGTNTASSTASAPEEDESYSDSAVHSLLHSDLGVLLPLHISLSRPVILRTEQRVAFAEILAGSVWHSSISPFTVYPETLKWVSNYEKTRWFLVLRVSRPENDSLNRLLGLCNSALGRFGQPPLYAGGSVEADANKDADSDAGAGAGAGADFSSSFHISIAWSLKEPGPAEVERVERIRLDKVKAVDIPFHCVKAKIGNYVESFELSVRV